jgi:hypothetical protein
MNDFVRRNIVDNTIMWIHLKPINLPAWAGIENNRRNNLYGKEINSKKENANLIRSTI